MSDGVWRLILVALCIFFFIIIIIEDYTRFKLELKLKDVCAYAQEANYNIPECEGVDIPYKQKGE